MDNETKEFVNQPKRTPYQRRRLWVIQNSLALLGLSLEACAAPISTSQRTDPTPVFVVKNQITSNEARLYEIATAQPQVVPEIFFEGGEVFTREDVEIARKSIVRLQMTYPDSNDKFGLSGVVTSISSDKLEIMTVRHAFEEPGLGDAGVPNLRRPNKIVLGRPDISEQEVVFDTFESIEHGTFEDGYDIAFIKLNLKDKVLPFDVEQIKHLSNYRSKNQEHALNLGYPYVYYRYNSNQSALAALESVLNEPTNIQMRMTKGDRRNVIDYTQLMCGDAPVAEASSGGGVFIKQNEELFCIGVNSILNNGKSCSAFIPDRDRLIDLKNK